MKEETFHEHLHRIVDEFVHNSYRIARLFPKEELFASSFQLRRAAMPIMLNYKEGFARRKHLVKINFYEISFGSCKESRSITDFAFKEKWIGDIDYKMGSNGLQEISAMLWKTIQGFENEKSK